MTLLPAIDDLLAFSIVHLKCKSMLTWCQESALDILALLMFGVVSTKTFISFRLGVTIFLVNEICVVLFGVTLLFSLQHQPSTTDIEIYLYIFIPSSVKHNHIRISIF